jgi:3D (Asp-Asp-Asp) domain-containing protein
MKIMNVSLILSFILFILPMEIDMMERKIEMEIKGIEPDIVTVTTYSPTVEQTDSTPLITASGFEINPTNPKKHRIVAVSRDLKKKYKFGKKVRITGIGKLSGTYTIRDVMNKRYKKRVDILIGEDDKQTSFKNAKLYAVVK